MSRPPVFSTAFLVVIALLIAACGSAENAGTTIPPPATQAELDVFCEGYEEVRDVSIGEQWEELLAVAPGEIHGELIRLTAGAPGESYWEDRETVEAFMKRCELD